MAQRADTPWYRLMTAIRSIPRDYDVRIDQQLKRELALQLCAFVDGWTQVEAAALLRLPQPKISALRRGRYAGFSVSRLIRLIAAQGYHVELHLKPIERRFALPKKEPLLSVIRYDRFGLPISVDRR